MASRRGGLKGDCFADVESLAMTALDIGGADGNIVIAHDDGSIV